MKVITEPEIESPHQQEYAHRDRDGIPSPATVIVGLGNDLLCDDGVGLYIARRLREILDPEDFEIRELSAGGMELVEQLIGRRRAVVIDACCSGRRAPGTLTRHGTGDFAHSLRLGSFHTVTFATALELARRLGAELPEQIDVFAIEARDTLTLSERCTEAVEAAIEPAAREIARMLTSGNDEMSGAGQPVSRVSD